MMGQSTINRQAVHAFKKSINFGFTLFTRYLFPCRLVNVYL